MAKKMSKRKIVLILIGLIAFAGVGNAVWFMTLATTTGYSVISDEPTIGYTTFFQGGILDVNTAEVILEDTAQITNPETNANFITSIDVIKTDVSDTCESYIDDCSTEFTIGLIGGEGVLDLYDGKEVMFKTGITEIKSIITCKKLSCPQDIEITIDFNSIEI